MIKVGEPTGETVRKGDPEPTNGEHLRSAVAVWARGDDGLWRVVNVSSTTGKAYPWDVLINCFRTMRVVIWP